MRLSRILRIKQIEEGVIHRSQRIPEFKNCIVRVEKGTFENALDNNESHYGS